MLSEAYSQYSDEELIRLTVESNDNGAVYYLLFTRYKPKLESVFGKLMNGNLQDYDSVCHDFFLDIKNNQWYEVRSWKHECSFGTWIDKVFYNYLLGKKKKDSRLKVEYVDDVSKVTPDKGLLVSGSGRELTENIRLALELEAVSMLKGDERYVTVKTLLGYSSKEIHNGMLVLRMNENKAPVTLAYIDTIRQRAKKSAKNNLLQLENNYIFRKAAMKEFDDNLLNGYLKGQLSDSERDEVRFYISQNPDVLPRAFHFLDDFNDKIPANSGFSAPMAKVSCGSHFGANSVRKMSEHSISAQAIVENLNSFFED